ncbi:hypothetical protein AM2_128 [Lactococcus phage AM2]|uniref:Uncharacterized protein n=7 Tax=Audreyjarvisvirus AM1 TaxID=2845188 RepID=A0A1W6JLR8_9CAUD|nr:hypothetical protein H1Z30_gp143 [Lactococcus phage AM1]ARM66433.1 hypothetical protein AM2_128 [Lactococcus phage AM2]ARM66610.1 hypothetical protein AM3_128 [Lactococcus phage AM3]ARM67164.1 hypothetical protein AM8_129 [Lactococcus phage AM8]ARM67342.1 hypothetical protein AM9_129 [Lactococcus phage AM9]ARM67521.1 hypothetical protein AM11_129 [Lactococcus phage AM11]ARQ95708.1 hypothetical protein AM12_129 [Lactococcus phage AM12]
MESIDVKFTIGVDEDWDEKFRLLDMNCYYDFDISQKLEMLDVIRKGLIEKEIFEVTKMINNLHHLHHSRQKEELIKLIEVQTKLFKGLKNNGN